MSICRASLALIVRGGEVLTVTNRSHGGFDLPGGRVEPGETWERTLLRELREELGILVGSAHVRPLDALSGSKPGWIVCVMHVARALGTPRAIEPGTKLRWAATRAELVAGAAPGYGGFYERLFAGPVCTWSGARVCAALRGTVDEPLADTVFA